MKVTIDIHVDPATDTEHLGWLRELVELYPNYVTVTGDLVQRQPHPLLADVLSTFRPGEDRLAAATICERLAAAHPARYTGWAPPDLTTRLARHSVTARKLALPGARPGFRVELRRGYRRQDLEAAR